MKPPRADIAVQRRVPPRGIPAPVSLRRFALAAGARGGLCLRIVGGTESRALNRRYRGKDKATNVLSFSPPAELSAMGELGDIVLCAPVIAAEARAQGKTAMAHWAHMVVHGVLHLRGYDHERAADALRMETEERRVLASLGIDDPYRIPESHRVGQAA